MAKLASKVYGEALFQIAVEDGRIDEMMEEMRAVRKALEENQELQALMTHPKIIKEEKVRLIENCFSGQVSDDVTGFLTVVVSKGRFRELPKVFDYLTMRVKEYKKIGVVTVISRRASQGAKRADPQQAYGNDRLQNAGNRLAGGQKPDRGPGHPNRRPGGGRQFKI